MRAFLIAELLNSGKFTALETTAMSDYTINVAFSALIAETEEHAMTYFGNVECCICYDIMYGDRWISKACGHDLFCGKCTQRLLDDQHPKCPLCRAELSTFEWGGM